MRRLLAAMEGQGDPEEALQLVEQLHRTQPVETPEDLLTWYAMGKILGEPLPSPARFDLREDEDNEAALYQTTAWAWMTWASGSKTKPFDELADLDLHTENKIIHFLALSNWTAAVQHLLKDNWSEAKRRYRRAVDVGSSFGTDTSTSILWSYGATFFTEVVSRETYV